MNFDDKLRWQYMCAAEVVNGRRLRGQPIPAGLKQYLQELEADSAEMSGSGPKTCDGADANPTMGVKEVATMLNITERHVRRIATRLGGRRVNGTWVFDRDIVENYRKQSA